MDLSNAPMLLNIVFLLIIASGILVGFIRGFKASLYWLVVKVAFYVFFFATIALVVPALYSANLPIVPPLFEAVEPTQSAQSFETALPIIMESLLGDSLENVLDNEPLMAFGEAVALFVLKIIYAVLYFTLFRVVYHLIFFIIRIIFFRTKKDVVKEKGKGRTAGMIFGAANGVLAVFIFLVFVGGMMSLLDDGLAMAEGLDTEENNELLMLSNETANNEDISDELSEIREYVDAYYDNTIVNLFSNWQTTDDLSQHSTPVHLHLFDLVFSMDYQDRRIAFRNEVSIVRAAADHYISSQFYETGDFSDIEAETADEIVRLLSTSELIVSVMPVGIDVASTEYDVELPITRDELYAIAWDEELRTMGSIGSETIMMLSEGGFFDEGEDAHLDASLDGESVRSVFNQMSESEFFTLLAPVGVALMEDEENGADENVFVFPEDLDWEKEYAALGETLGSFFDTDITLRDVSEEDIDVLLGKLSDFDFVVVLDSMIISETLINFMTMDDGMEGAEMLVIPDDIEWRDTYTDDDLSDEGELRQLMKALNELTNHPDLLRLEDVDDPLELLGDLDETLIDALLDSRIIETTLGHALYNMGQEEALLVPETVVASTVSRGEDVDYVIQDEVRALMDVAMLIDFDALSDENSDGFLAILEALEEDDVEQLLESMIMHATISDVIIDLESDETFVVPHEDSDGNTIRYESDGYEYLEADEIIALINAFNEVGDALGDGDAIDIALINEHSETLLDSALMHATISKMIEEMDSDEDFDFLVFPEETYEGNTLYVSSTLNGDDVSYVRKDEIIALFDALYTLGLDEESDSVNFEQFADDSEAVDILLASSILHATMSDVFMDMDGQGLEIPPLTYDNESDMIQTVGGTDYMDKDELGLLISGIATLGYSESEDFETGLDPQMISELSTNDLESIMESGVLHTTIDSMIKDNDNIDIPHEAQYDSDRYGVSNLIRTDESIAMIEATLVIMEDGDFTAVSFDFQDIIALEDEEIDTILDSEIVRYTINDDIEATAAQVNYTFEDEDYVNEDPSRYLTKEAVQDFIEYLESIQ